MYTIESLDKQFSITMEEIKFGVLNLESSYDRVKVMEWLRKLYDLVDKTDVDEARIRNEYAEYLRIALKSSPIYLFRPFKNSPPKGDLTALPEFLANTIVEDCDGLPKAGQFQPIICHKSPDGRAMFTVKRATDGEVYCYMSVNAETKKPKAAIPAR